MKYWALLILSTIFFTACNSEKTETDDTGFTVLDSIQGTVPYISKTPKGDVIISWVRQNEDSSHLFCYAVSKNGGKEFSEPIVIPGSDSVYPHLENLPKVLVKPSGEILALWGAKNPNPINKYSGLIFYSQSFDEGKTWSSPRKLVNDEKGYDQRYFDVALLPNGEAAITWLDNRKTTTKTGSSLYYATTNGKDGFVNEKLIAQPCCECCRTSMQVENGNIHVSYRAIINDSIRDIVHAVSMDMGKTFSEPKRVSEDNWVISGCPHSGGAMTIANNDVQFAWFTGQGNRGVYYTNSHDHGNNFSQRDSIGSMAAHPQMATTAKNDVIIVWDEAFKHGDEYFSRVGMEQRNSKGEKLHRDFVTPPGITAAYPVIVSDGDHIVLAFTIAKNKRVNVAYKTVKIPH